MKDADSRAIDAGDELAQEGQPCVLWHSLKDEVAEDEVEGLVSGGELGRLALALSAVHKCEWEMKIARNDYSAVMWRSNSPSGLHTARSFPRSSAVKSGPALAEVAPLRLI